jgi:hypothetical protein
MVRPQVSAGLSGGSSAHFGMHGTRLWSWPAVGTTWGQAADGGGSADLDALKEAPLGELVTLPGLLCGEACQLELARACVPRSTTGGLGACMAAAATGCRDLCGVVPEERQAGGDD